MSRATRREGTAKFGWCLDYLHNQCPIYTVSDLKCGCECHDTNATHPQ